eukprot:gnl/MRDRNA2_/MRDRNA2_131675_c0_seq1.p1 gnl/MRDRNA2_/MRDRNA2_131675_c0~~gnl/MRDRNA2_/MRDRNA2_131675_c0_seq1.p1  ORF type:complete len:211 (-),score=34.16 gnl/MRDRNA2_/MRDRNA2_131675_c0_seq1:109-741(-)
MLFAFVSFILFAFSSNIREAYGRELIASRVDRGQCPHWQHMGCILDTLEKACEPDGGDIPTLVEKTQTESVWMCCCPKPYQACPKNQRNGVCHSAMMEHIEPHIANPGSQHEFITALQRVRSALRDSGGPACDVLASKEPVSVCGHTGTPEVKRSISRPDLFCEMLTWQWEELGDGDPSEFEANGCPFIATDQAQDGEARKGQHLTRQDL